MQKPYPQAHIAFILVWSGKWRPWLHLYLHTCALNPEVDFLIFTDQPAPEYVPANVRIIQTSLADVAERTSWALGFSVEIERAYKLCDFKPLYGLLFADFLLGYTHWGYCDEDIFWGNLRKFLTDERCWSYDIVTACRCCIVGQMTLFRNSPLLNAFIMRAPRLREQLRDPGIHLLDEQIMNNLAREEEARGGLRVLRKQMQTHDSHSEEWSRWADDLEMAETGRRHGELKYGRATWYRGKLVHETSGEEFAFYHFGSWKKRWVLPSIPPPPQGIAGWRVSEDEIAFILEKDAGFAAHVYVWRHAVMCAVARVARLVDDGAVAAFQFSVRGARRIARGILNLRKVSRKLTTVSNPPFPHTTLHGSG